MVKAGLGLKAGQVVRVADSDSLTRVLEDNNVDPNDKHLALADEVAKVESIFLNAHQVKLSLCGQTVKLPRDCVFDVSLDELRTRCAAAGVGQSGSSKVARRSPRSSRLERTNRRIRRTSSTSRPASAAKRRTFRPHRR